jgi:hypothetical protein
MLACNPILLQTQVPNSSQIKTNRFNTNRPNYLRTNQLSIRRPTSNRNKLNLQRSPNPPSISRLPSRSLLLLSACTRRFSAVVPGVPSIIGETDSVFITAMKPVSLRHKRPAVVGSDVSLTISSREKGGRLTAGRVFVVASCRAQNGSRFRRMENRVRERFHFARAQDQYGAILDGRRALGPCLFRGSHVLSGQDRMPLPVRHRDQIERVLVD